MRANNYYPFRRAMANQSYAVANYLLTFPSVFAWAAQQPSNDYRQCLDTFVKIRLAALHRRPVEGIADHEAELCLCLLHYLIRKNEEGLIQEMDFLLSIPAMEGVAARDIRNGPLIQSARVVHNENAERRLMAFYREVQEKTLLRLGRT